MVGEADRPRGRSDRSCRCRTPSCGRRIGRICTIWTSSWSDDGKAVDTVDSYFGMRKIEVKKDDDGINRLWLNNEVLFQYGPLDQGWWPDGLYTPADGRGA